MTRYGATKRLLSLRTYESRKSLCSSERMVHLTTFSSSCQRSREIVRRPTLPMAMCLVAPGDTVVEMEVEKGEWMSG